jgi:hypothetical protein
MKPHEQHRYYVYCYYDPRNLNVPFYIGKGTGERYRQISCRKYNSYLYYKITKLLKDGYILDDIVVKIEDNLAEEQALNLEIELISVIGRIDISTGPLLNRTAGGDKFDYETNCRTQRMRVQNGTHNFLNGELSRKISNQRVKDGNHPFLGGRIQRNTALKRLNNGTHNFLLMKKPIKLECSDGRNWVFSGINDAIKQGFPKSIINFARKNNGSYTLKQRTSGKNTKFHFNKGDTIRYKLLD